MRFLLLLLCLAGCTMPLRAETIQVIAVHYPPFTSKTQADGGTVFSEIRTWLQDQSLDISLEPVFVPPARAQVMVNSQDWCTSLYPPPATGTHRFVKIGDHDVDIGFLRHKAGGPFTWTSPGYFRGKRLAVLRSRDATGILQPLKDAEAVLIEVETIQQGIKLLMANRVDFAFADHTTLNRYEAQSSERTNLEFSQTILRSFPVGLFVNAPCLKHFPDTGAKQRSDKEKTRPEDRTASLH